MDELDFLLTTSQEQRTENWHDDRLGKFTASNYSRLGKADKFSQGAMTYIIERAYERITGVSHDTFDGSTATEWGNEYEPIARMEYEKRNDTLVTEGGFCRYNDYFGGSPDGYVGTDGLIEIKCPYNSVNHIRTFVTGEIDNDYLYQMYANIIATRRKWCDYISYDPRLPKEARLYVQRVTLPEGKEAEMLERLQRADKECTEIIKKLTGGF